jgi:hypothetical protein
VWHVAALQLLRLFYATSFFYVNFIKIHPKFILQNIIYYLHYLFIQKKYYYYLFLISSRMCRINKLYKIYYSASFYLDNIITIFFDLLVNSRKIITLLFATSFIWEILQPFCLISSRSPQVWRVAALELSRLFCAIAFFCIKFTKIHLKFIL